MTQADAIRVTIGLLAFFAFYTWAAVRTAKLIQQDRDAERARKAEQRMIEQTATYERGYEDCKAGRPKRPLL